MKPDYRILKGVTHITGHTIGSNFVQGWWVNNGMVAFRKSEVIEGYEHCVDAAAAWLLKRGVKRVQILPYRKI